MRLKRNDPARRVTESVPTYWDKPGAAVTEIHRGLLQAGVRLADPVISFNDREQDARHTYLLQDAESGEEIENSMLVLTWHWLTETRCEVVAYLS